MDKSAWSALSVEQFAAYLDGNLSPEEMNGMEMLIADDPDMEDLVRLSDSIDEQMQRFEFEDTAGGPSPEAFLGSDDFAIPNLDALEVGGPEVDGFFEDGSSESDFPSSRPADGPDGFDGEEEFDGEPGAADPETLPPDDSGESNALDAPGDNDGDVFHPGEFF